MALSTRRGGRTRFTLILLILTSITLLTLDFRGFTPLNSVRSAVLDAFEPVGNFASDTLRPVGDAWNGAFDYDNVKNENEALRQRVDELEGQITSGDVAKQSLQQLLEQVDIPFVGDIPTAGSTCGVGRGRELRSHHRDRQGRERRHQEGHGRRHRTWAHRSRGHDIG